MPSAGPKIAPARSVSSAAAGSDSAVNATYRRKAGRDLRQARRAPRLDRRLLRLQVSKSK